MCYKNMNAWRLLYRGVLLTLPNSLQNKEVLVPTANVAKNKPFSTFWCKYNDSLTNNIHEWYSIYHAGGNTLY